ncbi:MAG: ATP-dependent phosphofructokinase / diphosphate-dependent phosphofructokinase [Candidatus Eremiobacteraeota bacterium]|jgi:6-phosphofructokinase 1|nr:ATP-dependent phosphofructokinase / diphosphate-dependent phosphofructokinase [Candidatus Eremiobacteraeota bacterium]
MNGTDQDTLAILVGGGPAPGINGVIASATIEARNHGLRVLGVYEGYRHLVQGDLSHVVELGIEDVSRLHFTGGSMLRTSRTNPAKDPESLRRCIRSLTMLGVRYLVTIGGDDTTFGASRIAAETKGRIGVATVPKTIDNDLPLPDNAPTFGFETARAVGSAIVENLMEDARTASRWYLAVTMGRKSGALALGICKAAGATLAIIPEEFTGERIALDDVVDTIVGAIVKRRANGHDHGVAVVAEGVAERLDPAELSAVATAARDAYGHVRLADVPLGSVLRDAVRGRLQDIGLDATVVPKDIGYELRSAKPVPFDAEYTRTLGYGAVRYLLGGGSGALIALSGGRIVPVTLNEMLDPATGRIRIRMVDVTTESYEVARKYMIRLEDADFVEPRLSRLAAQTSLTSEEFAARFQRLVG